MAAVTLESCMRDTALPTFLTHREPAWRDRSNYTLQAVVPGDVNTFEQLWVRKLDDTDFEVCCIPFFLYDVALGDVVGWNNDERIIRVVDPSGRYVFRVWFGDESDQREVVESLEKLGATLERSSTHLLAVDAKDERSAESISGYLLSVQVEGELQYETGRT